MAYKHTYLIQHVLDHTAERFPQKTAFHFHDQSLTYSQAAAKSNSLANLLVDRGVQRGDRVGIYLHKGLESVIALFAVLKAGGAYVPINPAFPKDRVEFLVQDCEIKHIISETAKIRVLQGNGSSFSQLKSIIGPQTLSNGDEGNPAIVSWDEVFQYPGDSAPDVPGLNAEDLSYIMYTSGSTGTPKGMMHTHYSGLSYGKAAAELYGFQQTDVLSNHSPLHYDMSTLDFFAGLLCGATIVIIPEEYKMLPASLSKLIQDEEMTVWFSVTTALVQLLLRGVLEERDLSALRWVLFGGEVFPANHLMALMALLPQARFSNIYGPSEVNQVTYFHVPPLPNKYETEYVPIGKLLDNLECLILDDQDQPVAHGEVGELLIRGATMMKGYWKRPDLTEKGFFRQHPYPGSAYEKLFYRTGDLVRLDEDDQLQFLGRRDRQVKVRGFRIELDEIEAAISLHEAVGETAVYIVGLAESAQIEAAVVLREGFSVTPGELKAFVRKNLAPEAQPDQIVFRDSFPRTGSGKISRRALIELSQMEAGVSS